MLLIFLREEQWFFPQKLIDTISGKTGIQHKYTGIAEFAFAQCTAGTERSFHLRVVNAVCSLMATGRHFDPVAIVIKNNQIFRFLSQHPRYREPFFHSVQISIAGNGRTDKQDLGATVIQSAPGGVAVRRRIKFLMSGKKRFCIRTRCRNGVGGVQRTAHTRHLAEQFGQDPCGTGRIPYRKYRLMRIDKVPGKRGERHQTGFKVIQQGVQESFAPALNFAKRFYGRMDRKQKFECRIS